MGWMRAVQARHDLSAAGDMCGSTEILDLLVPSPRTRNSLTRELFFTDDSNRQVQGENRPPVTWAIRHWSGPITTASPSMVKLIDQYAERAQALVALA